MTKRTNRNETVTRQVDCVETLNIYRSLKRMEDGLYSLRWRRALIHAIGMAQVCDFETQRKIREALGLP